MNLENPVDHLEADRTPAEDPWCIVLREVSGPALLAITGLAVEHEAGTITDSALEEQCYSIIRDDAPSLETRERWLSLLGAA